MNTNFAWLTVTLLVLSTSLFSDSIYFKNGKVLLNCKKQFSNEFRVFVTTSEGTKIFEWEEIERYVEAPYRPELTSVFGEYGKVTGPEPKSQGTDIENAKQINYPIIALGLVGVAFSIDLLLDANDIGDVIDDLEKIPGAKTGELKIDRKRKQAVGYIALAGSIVAMATGFHR